MRRTLALMTAVGLAVGMLAIPASAETALNVAEDTKLVSDHEGRVTITADDVTLDCAGHSITGTDFAGIWIYGRQNVKVKNCQIDGFDNGILVEEGRYITLKSNSISGPTYHGISLNHTSWITVKNNTVLDSPGALGFVVNESYHVDLVNNSALGDMIQGFHVVYGSGWNDLRYNEARGPEIGFFAGSVGAENSLRGNYATGGDIGFAIDRDSYDPVELRKNTAEGNVTGFTVSQTGGHLLVGNRAKDNSAHGFFLYEAYDNVLIDNVSTGNENGFALNFSTHNELRDNMANRNSRGGFDFWDRSSWNELTGNTADRNGLLGFWLGGPQPWQGSQYNVFKENRACHNGVWDAGEPYPSPNVENAFIDNRFCVTALYNVS